MAFSIYDLLSLPLNENTIISFENGYGLNIKRNIHNTFDALLESKMGTLLDQEVYYDVNLADMCDMLFYVNQFDHTLSVENRIEKYMPHVEKYYR